jgi:hypothetical protein
VDELPDTVTVVLLQSIVWLAPAVTLGRAPLAVTLTVPVLIHPLTGFVTVRV